MADQAL